MTNKIYVGNLPYTVTEQDLTSLFSPCGELSEVKLISDRATGRSKGFAFVEYASASSAQEAVSKLNGHKLQDRPLKVSLARESDRGDRGRFRSRGY